MKTLPQRITEKQIFETAPTFLALPEQFLGKLVTATPDVKNILFVESHAVATTVTALLNGQNGQMLTILGNGNTTMSDNTVIKTNTGANKVLLADIIYRFTHISGIWYEDE